LAKYYVVVIRSEAPILIRRRDAPQGTEGFENYIPGSSLAAAIARALNLGGGYELAAKGFSVSHAYPVKQVDGRWLPSMPAAPTSLRLKRVKEHEGPDTVVCFGANPVKARMAMQSYWEAGLGFPVVGLVKEVRLGTPLIVRLDKEPLRIDGLKCYIAAPAEVSAEVARDSVAVDYYRGTAEREMLFTYFALPAGSLFWATLSLPDDVEPPLEEALTIRVGGAGSRGYGRSLAVIAEYKQAMQLVPCRKLYLWSHAVPRHPEAVSATQPPGWSRARGPRMAVPSIPPGALVDAESLLGVDPRSCNAEMLRFHGALPPTGHMEPVEPPDLPRSYTDVSLLLGRIVSLLHES